MASCYYHGDQRTHIRAESHEDGPPHENDFGDARDVKLLFGVDVGKVHAPGMDSLHYK